MDELTKIMNEKGNVSTINLDIWNKYEIDEEDRSELSSEEIEIGNIIIKKYGEMFYSEEKKADEWFETLEDFEQMISYRVYNLFVFVIRDILKVSYNGEIESNNFDEDTINHICVNLALIGIEIYPLLVQKKISIEDFEEERFPIFLI